MDLKNLNNNILANRWKERFEQQTDAIKQKLDNLDKTNPKEYQLQIIKRTRAYPQIGDIFMVKPTNLLTFFGIVINNHINNINGDDLLLVLIFRENINIKEAIDSGIDNSMLLIPPQMVGNEYWTRGYFHCVDHIEIQKRITNYGFYRVWKGEFVDEYGSPIGTEPQLLGGYGVSTIIGIARKINQELIMSEII